MSNLVRRVMLMLTG